jgi:DNA-binding transcriptional LysR family regulator
MSKGHNQQMRGLPSLRALYIFEAASRHLNLMRAAEELGLTQGALSRQIRSLEDHFGVPLFIRTPRGLKSTEAGDVLRTHCGRAFRELQEGLGIISAVRGRQTLLVAVARSYSTRVLSHRIAGFVNRHPWIDLVLDGHRHLADLMRNEADAAIRVGDGRWPDATCEKIDDDPLFPVAAPSLIAERGSDEICALAESTTLLHFTERPYWESWAQAAGVALPNKPRSVRFSETVMMIEAAEAGQGIAIVRRSLVREALAAGRLIRLSPVDVDDGIGYYFCTTPDGARKETVRHFRDWVFEQAQHG